MNKHTGSFIAIILLVLAVVACAGNSLKPPRINLAVGKNENADPESTFFKPGETIYAVATITNSSSSKVRFKVMHGDTELLRNEVPASSGEPAKYQFTMPEAGQYKVRASLIGKDGSDLMWTDVSISVSSTN